MYLMGMEYSTSETIFPDEERIELIKKNQEKRLEVAWPVFVSNLQSQMPHASKAKRESLRGRIKNGKQVLENAAKRVTTSRPRQPKGSRYDLPKTPYRRLRRHISHTIEGT